MGAKRPVALAISLDVEEEGLFSGRYPAAAPRIENVRHLDRLAPVFERGARLTFFCAHCAFVRPQARAALNRMRHAFPVEIGAHLHHWNTPCATHDPDKILRRPWTALLPSDEMLPRLETLFKAAKNFTGEPVTAFRMGRWDLLKAHWPLLKEMGVLVDASVRPLHSFAWPKGPDHYDAPSDPYLVDVDGAIIREVPLTVTPLSKFVAARKFVRVSLRKWGALALLPVEHPLWLMKLVTLAHLGRGGRTLSLTWHSSDLMPGGNPALRGEGAIKRLLDKICSYLDWLDGKYSLEYLTISEMGQKFAARPASGCGDWNFGAREEISHE